MCVHLKSSAKEEIKQSAQQTLDQKLVELIDTLSGELAKENSNFSELSIEVIQLIFTEVEKLKIFQDQPDLYAEFIKK